VSVSVRTIWGHLLPGLQGLGLRCDEPSRILLAGCGWSGLRASGRFYAAWVTGAEGKKMRTSLSLSSRAVVLGAMLVLLVSMVSGSVCVGSGVMRVPPIEGLRTWLVGNTLRALAG